MTLAGWGAVFGRSLLEWRKCLLSGRQLESLLRLWTFLLSSACVCVSFDFLTCSFILSPWRNKKWVNCCDCFMLPDAQASLVRSWIPWRLVNSLLGWVMLPSVVKGIQTILAPNQNGMPRLGNLRVARPLTTRPGMWLSGCKAYEERERWEDQCYACEGSRHVSCASCWQELCCSSGTGRFQSMEPNSRCDGQVCRYELVFLRAPCGWWGRCKDCTLHLMDCWHLRHTCRQRSAEPSGRFWFVCQGLRLETQDKGLSKEDQVNPRWIMGISDRCSYSPWVVAKHCFVIFW